MSESSPSEHASLAAGLFENGSGDIQEDALVGIRRHDDGSSNEDVDVDDDNELLTAPTDEQKVWSPSGSNWRDFLYFCGPGWFVSSKYYIYIYIHFC
jgi:hypothetical protein